MNPRRLTTLALLVAIVPLLGWWVYGLFDLDEGFYAAVVAEMNRRGEWVTPYYNGEAWFEKPILLYWLAKPFLALFGDMIGPRLPSVLSAIGAYVLVAWYARRRLSEEAATIGVLALGSSLLFVAVGRLMMTDMPLVLAFSAAMLTFWESLVGDRRWRLATAALLGVAVLAKGPVALILFALIAGWTAWRQPSLRPAFRGHWIAGTLILAAVVATWYVPAYLANGQLFVDKFLIEQNIGRFTGGDKAHTIKATWAYILYIPVLIVGMSPWSFFLLRSWRRTGAAEPAERESFERYLAAWAGVIFIFFSISSAKLPHYILPICVPLAMLVEPSIRRWRPLTGTTKRWLGISAALCIVGIGLLVSAKVSALVAVVGLAAFILLLLLWGDWIANGLRAGSIRPAIVWCVTLFVILQGGFMVWYEASGQREAHELARYMRDNSILGVPKSVAVFQMPRRSKDLGTGKPKLQETSLPSLLLYLDATVTEAETADKVIAGKCNWLFTRKGRITPKVVEEFEREKVKLVPIGPTMVNFELYELKPLTAPAQ